MKTRYAKLLGSVLGFVLIAAPSLGVALIISEVEVSVGGAVYCDTGAAQPVACAAPNHIWNLGVGGVNLNPFQTLILTQVGALGAPRGGENFDASDRGAGPDPLVGCSTASGTPCSVLIWINGVLVENDLSGNANPLTAFNLEPSSNENLNTLFQEDANWVPAPNFTGSGFTLDLGYADNIHGGNCTDLAGAGCFPQHVWGPAAATVFVGSGIGAIGNCVINTFGGTTHPNTDSAGNIVGCYDGGALRITANQVPEPSSLALLGVALAGLGGLRRRRSA